MDSKYLLSDNPQVVARALSKAVQEDRQSTVKKNARNGQRYYDYEHDILKNRIFYIDDNDVLVEDTGASNVKIPHTFFTELVDQKVQYLLSKPVEVKTLIEDEQLEEYLEEYYNDDFQLFLQEAVEGSSIKGFEYIFGRTNDKDKLCFQVSDSLQTFPVYDDSDAFKRNVRYYNREIYRDGKNVDVTIAEVWDENNVTFYITDKNNQFNLDLNRPMNPRPHVIAQATDGTLLKRSYSLLPFYRLSNNKREKTDLEPIKPLIDDYDLMACFLSNNLQDFSEAIYVVKGFRGDNLSKVRQNIKSKKVVGVKEDGGLDVKTVDIPIAARQAKLDIDKEAIYKFGMGFDSTQIASSSGTVTNVAIQSGYALLNMKVNKAEVRLRSMLAWINEMIIADINRRYNTAYVATDLEVVITKETMVDKKEIADIQKIEAETKKAIIDSILAVAPRLDDESILKLICEQFDLSWEEIQVLIEEQDYTSGMQEGTDPVETKLNEQVSKVAATLNGAQITSMMSVVEKVTAGTLSPEQGLAILTGSLGIDAAQAKQVIGIAEEVAPIGTT